VERNGGDQFEWPSTQETSSGETSKSTTVPAIVRNPGVDAVAIATSATGSAWHTVVPCGW